MSLPLVFSTLGCPQWTLEQAAEAAVASGYVGLEVRMLDGQIIQPDLPVERRQQIKRLMADKGLVIAGLGVSTRFSAADPAERQANVDQLRQYIDLANDLESPMVRTFGGNVADGHTVEDAINWVAQGLNAVAARAEKMGVTVVLETHDAFCRGQEVAASLAQVDSPNIQAVWDVHHPFRMGESIEDTWNYIGKRTVHMHMKDARKNADGSWQLVLMGEGQVPNREIVELLLAKGYTGYLSAEWEKAWHPEIEDPEIALPQHAQKLREWMGV